MNFAASTVALDSHTTLVKAYPATIDLEELARAAESKETKEYESRSLAFSSQKVIVRVDRVDPTKNIAQGFRAYSLMLERHPELIGRIKFLAFLVPAPLDIPEYRRCQEEIDREVAAINTRFACDNWQRRKIPQTSTDCILRFC